MGLGLLTPGLSLGVTLRGSRAFSSLRGQSSRAAHVELPLERALGRQTPRQVSKLFNAKSNRAAPPPGEKTATEDAARGGATARHRASAPRGHPQAREVRSSTERTLGAEPRARPAPSVRPTPRVRRALGDVLNYVSHNLPGPSLPATTAEAVTGSGPATHRRAWSLWRR